MREYFDTELKQLNNQLIEMASLVEQAINNTVDMLLNVKDGDVERAEGYEEKINSAEISIQNHCVKLLLHQSPVAGDLRYISAALKMITDLERIGDQAIDIAEMSVYMSDKADMYSMTHLSDMAAKAAKMVTMAIDAFVKNDLKLAKKVSDSDDEIDALFDKVKDETVEIIHGNKDMGTQAIDVVMVAKYFERIGDHAVNIAEWVAYSVNGTREFY